ncbi:MAG: immunoglobulin domain-containing protein, partial [Planctomycetota bacterium]
MAKGLHGYSTTTKVLLRAFLCAWLIPGLLLGVEVNAVIDFDFQGLPAGTILSSLEADGGGNAVGPIGVRGTLPSDPVPNRALIFNSANPTGGDLDLGTPNADFGGPGIGPGGEMGSPFQNDTELFNLLIIAEDLVDGDDDGLIDDPDDAAELNMIFDFDFSTITAPFIPENITIFSITTIDGEASEAPGTMRLYDSSDVLIGSFMLVATGCNGVGVHTIGSPGVGVSGVNRIEVKLDGSGAIDNIVFKAECALEITAQPVGETACDGDSVTFTVTPQGLPPFSYQWRMDGVLIPGANGDSYTIPAVAEGDAGSYDVVISNSCEEISSDPAVLVVQVSPVIISDPMSSTACEGGVVKFTVVASGTEPLSYQWRVNGVPIPGETGPSLALDPVILGDVGSYDVVVSNVCDAGTSQPASLDVKVEPNVTVNPQDEETCEGASVTFMASANGTAPLSFQWRFNGVDVPGETSTSLIIDPVTPENAGSYDLVVINDCGEASSSAATLTVLTGPVVVSDPSAGSACEGDSVTLSVTASGSEPLSYQWRKDSLPLPGETSSTLTINPVGLGDAGSYDVVVTNDCDEATSGAALVTVLTGPVIASSPSDATACEGNPVTLTVTASGSAPLSYQWRKNGVPIPGETNPSLTINPVAPGDAGSYDVMVSSECGEATSSAGVLTVLTGPAVVD